MIIMIIMIIIILMFRECNGSSLIMYPRRDHHHTSHASPRGIYDK